MVKSKSSAKREPLRLLSYGQSVSTPTGLAAVGGLALGTLSLLLQIINYGATSTLSRKEAPSLVQLENGDTIPVRAVEPKERSKEVIKKFISNSMVKMFNWDGLITSVDNNGDSITNSDKGVEIKTEKGGYGKVTTKAWEAAFALSEKQDFRASFLKKLTEITPSGIFSGNMQMTLVPRYISDPRKIKEGKWEIDLIATLVRFDRDDNSGNGIAFNKTITVEAVSTPQSPPDDTTELAKKIYNIRQAGLEITEIVDTSLIKKN